MKDHTGDVRGFSQLSRAWYGTANLAQSNFTDSVTFGLYSPDGGTSGEMSMEWISLSGSLPSAKLACFEDAFHALGEFADVIRELAAVDGENIQPDGFCNLLVRCGFKDQTNETSPYPPTKATCPTCGTAGVELPRTNSR